MDPVVCQRGTQAMNPYQSEQRLGKGRLHGWNWCYVMLQVQGCGIKGFIPTSVIQGNPLFTWGSLWGTFFLYHRSGHFPQPWKRDTGAIYPASLEGQNSGLLLQGGTRFDSPRTWMHEVEAAVKAVSVA